MVYIKIVPPSCKKIPVSKMNHQLLGAVNKRPVGGKNSRNDYNLLHINCLITWKLLALCVLYLSICIRERPFDIYGGGGRLPTKETFFLAFRRSKRFFQKSPY